MKYILSIITFPFRIMGACFAMFGLSILGLCGVNLREFFDVYMRTITA
ncbi:MAG: hypothetical protein WDA59_07270 [Methanofastidiosum sp.]